MNEKQNTHDTLRASSPIFLAGLALATGVVLSQFAFSKQSRRIIVERAGGRCEWEDGTCVGGLEAAHLFHQRGENYDNPDSGILLCTLHHLAQHMAYRRNPNKIGLSKRHNNWAIKSLEARLEHFKQQNG